MNDKQFEKLLELVKPPEKSRFEKMNEAIKFWVAVISLVASVYFVMDYSNVKADCEMMKAYFSAQQSKYAELIGNLRGQGDKKTADILEILKEQSIRDAERINLKEIKYEEKKINECKSV